MPEVICFAHLIVFWALMLGYFRVRSEDASKGKGYIIAAIALSMLMTFMRPYLILFLVFPLLVLFVNAKGKKKKLIVVGISLVIMGITAFIYYLLPISSRPSSRRDSAPACTTSSERCITRVRTSYST